MRLGLGLSITGQVNAAFSPPELIVNGTFDTDISGWTDDSESGGSISWNPDGYLNLSTGSSNSNEGKAFQNVAVEVGKIYRVKFTVVSGGGVVYKTEGPRGVGSYEVIFTADSGTYQVLFRNFANLNGTSSIDNVSLKEVSFGPELVTNSSFDNGTTGWTAGDAGTTISASEGILSVQNGDTSSAYAEQSVPITIGDSYKLEVKANSIEGIDAGNRARLLVGGFDSGNVVSTDTYIRKVTPNTTGDLILSNGLVRGNGDIVTWEYASVKIILDD